MRVLIDMDGVLADFEAGFLRGWRAQYPQRDFVPWEQRTSFRLTDQYPAAYHHEVRQIYCAPGFFRALEPFAGGIEAVREMDGLGIEVFICSSPLSDYRYCVGEKYAWIDQHLGYDWTKKLILTKDKTLVRADFLIDDKPEVEGVETPAWEHILFDAPYNRARNGKRRLSWENWRAVLLGK